MESLCILFWSFVYSFWFLFNILMRPHANLHLHPVYPPPGPAAATAVAQVGAGAPAPRAPRRRAPGPTAAAVALRRAAPYAREFSCVCCACQPRMRQKLSRGSAVVLVTWISQK